MGLNFRLEYNFTFFKFDFRRANDRLVIDILAKIEASSSPFISLKRFYITTRLHFISFFPIGSRSEYLGTNAKVLFDKETLNLRVRVGNFGRGMN